MINALVILNFNSSNLCIKYICSMSSYKVINHIVVVDNASSEDERRILRDYCEKKHVHYIQLKMNRGYASGNNVGVKYAIEEVQADVVIISNPDIICPKDTVNAVLSRFYNNEDVAVITGLVHNFDNNHNSKIYPYYAYRVPSLKDMILNNFLLITKIRRSFLKTSMYYDVGSLKKIGEQYVECVSGCFFAIRSNAFVKIKGFDEDTFLYYEEAILGHKLKGEGYKILVLDYPVFHDEDPGKNKTLKKLWRTHVTNQYSAKIYMKKYLSAGSLWLYIQSISAIIGFAERLLYGFFKR